MVACGELGSALQQKYNDDDIPVDDWQMRSIATGSVRAELTAQADDVILYSGKADLFVQIEVKKTNRKGGP